MFLHPQPLKNVVVAAICISVCGFGLYRAGRAIDNVFLAQRDQGRRALADADLRGAKLRGERPAPEMFGGIHANDGQAGAVVPMQQLERAAQADQFDRAARMVADRLEPTTFGDITCRSLTVRDPDGGPEITCRTGRDFAGVWVRAGDVHAILYAKDGHAWVGVQDRSNRQFGANWALAVDRQWGCLLQLNDGDSTTQFKLSEVREALKRAEAQKIIERIPKPLPRQDD